MTKLTRYHQQNKLDLVQSAFDNLSKSTQAGYQTDYDGFNAFVNKPLNQVTPSDVIGYFRHLQSKKYKNATINRKIASVSKLFKVYVSVGALKVNPVEMARQLTKLTARTIRVQKSALTLENVRDCVNAKDIHMSDMHSKYIIKFMAKTGMRVSEALGVRFKDITDIDGVYVKISVLGKGRVERPVFIDKETIDEIRAVFKHEQLLFCNKRGLEYSRIYMWRLVKDRFKRTVELSGIHPHSMRHFYATYKIGVEGKDINAVSKALGHADPSTTLRFYNLSTLDAENSGVDV